MSLLEVRDLVVHYGRLPALNGVSIDVPEGSAVALLGPNGAGKTTLLNTIAGALSPTSGSVTLDGVDVAGRPAYDLFGRGICLIPEGRGVFPNMTVADNLRIALAGQPSSARELVFEAFPRLRERVDQLAGTMSGGEQQMLALARAMGTAPRVLMADEVSLGLAPLLVAEIFDALRKVHREEGRTMLIVEQYATHALSIADHVYILSRGQVAWEGTPEELRSSGALLEQYLGAA